MINPLIVLWVFLVFNFFLSLDAFKILSSLAFGNLIIMCLILDLFRVNLFEAIWAF